MPDKINITPEALVYWAFLVSLAISITGLAYLRYTVYLLPFFATLVWMLSGNYRIYAHRELRAFILLFFLSVLSLIPWDLNTFKKVYFVYVFLSVFLLFDFSRIDIDFRKLALIYITFGLITGAMRHVGMGIEDFSVTKSRSFFENTFAFPLGLLCLYFFLYRRYLWGLVAVIFLILFLKRIVFVALGLSLVVWLLPATLRRVILNPVAAIIVALIIIWFSVEFSQGNFDRLIFEYLDISPNQLSQGRQMLWISILRSVNFDYESFLFWGEGVGKIKSSLEAVVHVEKILLHNDLLSLVLEIGLLFYIIFIYLFADLRYDAAKLFSFFMLVLFATDNVLIYQHVMFTYFFIQAQIRREFFLARSARVLQRHSVSFEGSRRPIIGLLLKR